MPASFTPNLNLALPQVDVDAGWGTTLNSDFVAIDNIFAGNGTGTSVGVNVGNGKTLTLGGTMILGRGDGTNTVVAPVVRGAARTGTNAVGANLTIDAPNGTGSGGSGSIIMRTAPAAGSGTTASTFQNTLALTESGNIGVGTTDVTSGSRLVINNTASASATSIALLSGGTYNGQMGLGVLTGFGDGVGLNARQATGTISLGTNNTERIRISQNGALGMGGANYGTAGQILTSNGTASTPSWQNNQPLNKFSSQSLIGLSDVTFSGIAAATELVYIVFHKVLRGAASSILIQLGDSGGVETSGYDSYSGISTSTSLSQTSTNGFVVYNNSTSAEISGVITLARIFGNTWDCSYTLANTGTNFVITGGGSKSISADLTTIKIVGSTVSNFTSGNVRVMYML